MQNAFEKIAPDLIHSNMQEGYELIAASKLKIPVVTTIHIGSVICPRGGNGLWTKDDKICDGKIGKSVFRVAATNYRVLLLQNQFYDSLHLKLKNH